MAYVPSPKMGRIRPAVRIRRSAGQKLDGNRPKNWGDPDRNWTETGQTATSLFSECKHSKECQIAFFPQFFSSAQRLVAESIYTSRGVKRRKNGKKNPSVRQRVWTKSQFHSYWWFAAWLSRLEKMRQSHFREFSSCIARSSLRPASSSGLPLRCSPHKSWR